MIAFAEVFTPGKLAPTPREAAKYTYKQVYAALALLPVAVVMLGEQPAARDFWVDEVCDT